MNQIIMSGRLTADPEEKVSNGKESRTFCTFSIAEDSGYDNDTHYHDVVVFREGLADFSNKYLFKGKKVLIVGTLTYNTYQPKGTKVNVKGYQIIAQRIEFMDSKKKDETEG